MVHDLYQETILDHSKRPRNFHSMENATRQADGYNPLCGDQLRVYLHVRDNQVQEVSFEGSGCAISKASASILTESLKGKTRGEVRKIFDKIHELVTSGEASDDLGKLAVLGGVHKFPARVKCAILSWHGLMAALKGQAQPVSTEDEHN